MVLPERKAACIFEVNLCRAGGMVRKARVRVIIRNHCSTIAKFYAAE